MPRISIFYHYLYPDPVVSSVLFSELATGLAERGWQVTAYSGNRGSGQTVETFPPRTTFKGVLFRRLWCPKWSNNRSSGRILNALWLISRWSALAFRPATPPDVILMGTDPILSVVIAPVWRLLHPKVKIVHWCFDVYPEAAFADGLLDKSGWAASFLRTLAGRSYRTCDLVGDIGSCMRRLLLQYDPNLPCSTLVPWALAEPEEPVPIPAEARKEIFGAATLGLMYSGTLGRAHSYEDLLLLMRQLRGSSVHLAFSVRGNRAAELNNDILPEDTNIRVLPFAAVSALETRLATADVHIVSLRPEWTGTVVPSKFFGALAVGRPILFCGSSDSSIAQWILEHGVGWILEPGNSLQVAEQMKRLAEDSSLEEMRVRCHVLYQRCFARSVILEKWHEQLTTLLAATMAH